MYPDARTGPMTGPCAILISGAPGIGKSTLAAALAPRLGAAVLDLDVATGPLTGVVSTVVGATDLSDPRMARLTRAARYETLLALAEDNLRAGTSVVLVAPFTAERSESGWRVVAERLGAYAGNVVLVWLHLSPDRLAERLQRRGAARDSEKLRDPAAFVAALDRDPPAAPHLALDADGQVTGLVEGVVAHLASARLAIDGTP